MVKHKVCDLVREGESTLIVVIVAVEKYDTLAGARDEAAMKRAIDIAHAMYDLTVVQPLPSSSRGQTGNLFY
ncbi:MAG: hypothetical protein WBW31_12640 [Candidatus Sulfotelmatobacter sp.]